MVPFVLVMMGLIWDLREYVSHRTELAREMYVVAEVIANDVGSSGGDSPIETAVGRATDSLTGRGAGRISVAVITRGNRRDAGASDAHPDCADEANWCLPRVAHVWPPAPPHADADGGTWNDGGGCATFDPGLPNAGQHFAQDAPVLPNEVPADVTPRPAQEDWLSRNMRTQEWWVLVDTCFHSDGGLFGGMLLRGLRFFDIAQNAFVMHRRAAWGSVHDYSDCNWCPAQ